MEFEETLSFFIQSKRKRERDIERTWRRAKGCEPKKMQRMAKAATANIGTPRLANSPNGTMTNARRRGGLWGGRTAGRDAGSGAAGELHERR
jgi:hypothetical protein